MARSSPSSPMYRVPSSEMLAVLRSHQQSPGVHSQGGGIQQTGSGGKCFTDEACERARLDAQDMQVGLSVCLVGPSLLHCLLHLVL